LQNQTGTTENNYLYTGQQFDKSTGLYDLRARFYSPNVGRFLSQDTYAVNFNNPIELNRYGYAANNPVNASDPSGHNFLESVSLRKDMRSLATINGGAIPTDNPRIRLYEGWLNTKKVYRERGHMCGSRR
jgi:RHS repeat-associated protein